MQLGVTTRQFVAVLAAAVLAAVPIAIADEEQYSLNEILLHSNDNLDLVNEYWPKIRSGSAKAMAISHEAINNCTHFRSKIQAANTIDDFDLSMQDEQPAMQRYGHGVYFKCKRLVERFEDFPGWERLRLRAALAGDPMSRLYIVSDFYRFRNETPRESFSFSPALYITEALDKRNPAVFMMFAVGAAPWGMRKDADPIVSIAWELVACEYTGNCDARSSLENACLFMTDDCLKFDNVYEMLRARAGGDDQYARARELADDLKDKVEAGLYDDLGLDLVW